MSTIPVVISTGFEAGNLGAVVAYRTQFSSSVTFTPGYSLLLEQGTATGNKNSWIAYKFGARLDSYNSIAFLKSKTIDTTPTRAIIMEIANQSRLPETDLQPFQDYIGSVWYINANGTLGAAAVCGNDSGRTNYGNGDLITIDPTKGETAGSIWMTKPIVEDRWYWLETHTTIALVEVDGDEIMDVSAEGYLNGEYLGSVDFEAFNPPILDYCRTNGYDWKLEYMFLRSSYPNIMYFDNYAGHTDWLGEGVSYG